jgi:hypothetical protein
MAKPPATATGTDRRLPMRAAARAGTISAVRPIGVMAPWRGPRMMAEVVASSDARIQLILARRSGE